MKKKLFFAGAALMLAAAVTGFAAYDRSNESDLFNANVEALAENEFDPEMECYNYCKDERGYICTLKTNVGFEIDCYDMVRRY